MNKLPYLKNGKAKENVWGNQGDSFHKSPTKFAVNDIDLDQNKSQLVHIVAYGCSKCMQNGKVLKKQIVLNANQIVHITLDGSAS